MSACEIDWLHKVLVWSFVLCAFALALVSRKLNRHLLTVPPQPTGAFSALFRRKYHVKPGFLFDPARHFDTGGQKWARVFTRLLILSALLLVAMLVHIHVCGRVIVGGAAD